MSALNSSSQQSVSSLIAGLTPSARRLPESGIVKVFNYGRTREGLVPLWAGEGDMPTPAFISNAATAALAAGETFYTYQRGIPPLREALADYFSRQYGRAMSAEEFFVTGGGMQAIQTAVQLVVGDGDDVVVPSPAWPNFEGAITARGGRVSYVPMELRENGWTLDLDRLFDACGPKTRALFINSPSNPTGWTASEQELRAILDFARSRGIWIIADEIYGRFYFGEGAADGGGRAPSFQTMREADDRILFVQTFSKMWAMTGWRLGWLQAPAQLGQVIENLVQYNTSGVAPFLQRAGVVALGSGEGEAFARGQIARAAEGRKILAEALRPYNSVRFAPPAGAFYQFFAIDGLADSTEAALRLVDEANIGLAPGAAFGPGGEGHFRICFLRSGASLQTAMERLTAWFNRR